MINKGFSCLRGYCLPEKIAISAKAILYSLVLGLALTSCATYHPKPLPIWNMGARPSILGTEKIKIKARSIRHPILKPLNLNLNDGISPDEAAVLAVITNPGLRSIRDRKRIAMAQLIQAGILPNPQVSYNLDFPTGGDTKGTTNAFGLGLNWNVESLIFRRSNLNSAEAHARSVNLDVAWKEWQIAEAAKLAVYKLIGLEEQLRLSKSMELRMKKNLEMTKGAYRSGLLTKLGLAATETAYARAHSRVIKIQQSLQQQRLKLNRIIGVSPDTKINIQSAIGLPHPLKFPRNEYKDLVAGLEKRRLDLVALRLGYKSQEARLRVAILKQFPGITIGVNHARDNSNVYTTGFSVSIDLPVFDRNQGQIALERATRQQLYDEYLNRVFEAHSDIAKLISKITSVSRQIQAKNLEVDRLKQLVDTYRIAVEEGQADVLNYYNTWNNLTEKRIDIISLRQELASLRTGLELSSGLYQLDSKGKSSSLHTDKGGNR